ncbi:hypothetical protein EVAR_60298_1 [Eumeta japonica]|uniref:Uncharacterized protein n=1 Tax=Eumeta variegata TaxID=151549 RepID=A0A4C1ZRM8_EUMVA|nr:hypothetical protein EVAR_60298_1 [Eumeta japonica]
MRNPSYTFDSDPVSAVVFEPSPVLSCGPGLAFDSDPGSVLDSDFCPAFNSDSATNHRSDLIEAEVYSALNFDHHAFDSNSGPFLNFAPCSAFNCNTAPSPSSALHKARNAVGRGSSLADVVRCPTSLVATGVTVVHTLIIIPSRSNPDFGFVSGSAYDEIPGFSENFEKSKHLSLIERLDSARRAYTCERAVPLIKAASELDAIVVDKRLDS